MLFDRIEDFNPSEMEAGIVTQLQSSVIRDPDSSPQNQTAEQRYGRYWLTRLPPGHTNSAGQHVFRPVGIRATMTAPDERDVEDFQAVCTEGGRP